MSKLFELLGKNAASPEARQVLAKYPDLRSEVEDVGDESIAPVRYLRSEDDGLLIKCSSEGEIQTIFLMSEGKEGFSQFDGELPGHLTFDSSPEDALRALGPPALYRAAGRVGDIQQGVLMRFDAPNHSVNFQFRGDGRGVLLVTVMTARAVPGRSHAT